MNGDPTTANLPPTRDLLGLAARKGAARYVAIAGWILFALGFLLQAAVTIDQIHSLGTKCEGSWKARQVAASLSQTEIVVFVLVYAVPGLAAFLLLKKTTSGLALAGALLAVLVSDVVACAFAFAASLSCFLAGW